MAVTNTVVSQMLIRPLRIYVLLLFNPQVFTQVGLSYLNALWGASSGISQVHMHRIDILRRVVSESFDKTVFKLK